MINASENAVIIPKTFQLYAMYDVAKVSWKLYKMMTHWKPFLWINFNQHKRFQRIWIFDSRIFQLNVRFKMVYLICVFSLHISHSIFNICSENIHINVVVWFSEFVFYFENVSDATFTLSHTRLFTYSCR